MTKKNRCYVGSEIGQLRRVILHRPDLSLQRLTPSNCESMLFDDVLQVETAGKEHDQFSSLLVENDVEVFLLKDLLTQVCADKKGRQWLLSRQCSPYYLGMELANRVHSFLSEIKAEDCSNYLLGGITRSELILHDESLTSSMLRDVDFIIPPLPNHLFTRDTSCWIYNGVSINPMARLARKRESVNLRAIYKFHPLFADKDYHNWYGDNDRFYERATIEGGDVLVLGNGVVMIGLGERTTPQAFELLAASLFKENSVRQIIAVQLPKERASMHLDTVTTMLDYNSFTYYPPIMDNCRAWQLNKGNKQIQELREPLYNHIARELDVDKMILIPTGGDPFQMEREQWNDANNVLTIRPGVVVGYEKNYKTIEAMAKAGISVLTITGNELGRGRGGPRCMSCPFERDPL